MTVGGTTIQSLHGDVRFDDKGWSLNDFAFRAPGLTEVKLSGRLDNGPQGLAFSGPASIESADLKTLMAWLEGRGDQPSGPAETLTAHGDVTIAQRPLRARPSVGGARSGEHRGPARLHLGRRRPAGGRSTASCTRPTLNIDALVAFAKAATSDSALEVPREVALVLDVGKATFAGVEARAVNAQAQVRCRHPAHRPAVDRRSWRAAARHQRTHRRIVVAAARAR